MNRVAMKQARNPLREVARLFFKLGCIAFGGPAAHIAMMEDEVVERRQWLSRQHFLDLVGATNLIPGPNSTEMTMHVGYERNGVLGLFVAGALFILPAALITGILAWAYVTYGALPAVAPLLLGIKPAVIAVILAAVYRLGEKAVKGWHYAVLGVVIVAMVLAGVHEVVALFGGGLVGIVWLRIAPKIGKASMAALMPVTWSNLVALADAVQSGSAHLMRALAQTGEVTLWQLALAFLKIGAILYGSGYVLIAFLEADLVTRYGWITQDQLLDAIAVGQFTPGPVLTTATFVGYLIAGTPGAIVATVAIFLPSFAFVWILNPIVPRLRRNQWSALFLDSINVASLALMLAVALELARSTLVNWPAWIIAVIGLVAAVRFKVNAVWLILGSALFGYLIYFVFQWAQL